MKINRAIIVLALAGVGTLFATEPIDDVYYWPEVQKVNTQKAEKLNASAQTKAAENVSQAQPMQAVIASETPAKESVEPQKVEFVNIQDTVVTVRIKR